MEVTGEICSREQNNDARNDDALLVGQCPFPSSVHNVEMTLRVTRFRGTR